MSEYKLLIGGDMVATQTSINIINPATEKIIAQCPVAKQIDSRTVWINQHCVFGPHIPFPPAKESGIGVEWGIEGLHEFTAMQVININKA